MILKCGPEILLSTQQWRVRYSESVGDGGLEAEVRLENGLRAGGAECRLGSVGSEEEERNASGGEGGGVGNEVSTRLGDWRGITLVKRNLYGDGNIILSSVEIAVRAGSLLPNSSQAKVIIFVFGAYTLHERSNGEHTVVNFLNVLVRTRSGDFILASSQKAGQLSSENALAASTRCRGAAEVSECTGYIRG